VTDENFFFKACDKLYYVYRKVKHLLVSQHKNFIKNFLEKHVWLSKFADQLLQARNEVGDVRNKGRNDLCRQ
jgi:ABC-type polysaccharide/polyol phosphate transport system ATPase subunit